MPRGVTENIRAPQEGVAKEIHKVVERGVYGQAAYEAARDRWIGKVLDEQPVDARKPVTYRYEVAEVYRDDLKRLIAKAYLVEQ